MPTVRQASAAHLHTPGQLGNQARASHQPLWVVSDTARLHHVWRQATTTNVGCVAALMELTLVQHGCLSTSTYVGWLRTRPST